MITLPIKKQWYDMILSGEKKEEYRSITKRYATMFQNATCDFPVFQCRLRNGYAKSSRSMIISCTCRIDCGKSEWGAEPNTKYFVLSILSFEEE